MNRKTTTLTILLRSFLILLALSALTALSSCKAKQKEIAYGQDHCHFCDMTIVDKAHASEYVTKKGKAYKFDAIECLVHQINKSQNEDDLAFILVADYENPGTLVDASSAAFLQSKAIKSPMGANLSAFHSKKAAEATQKEHGGEVYTWSELKKHLHK